VILSLRYDSLQPRSLRGDIWLSCNQRPGFNGHYRVEVSDRKEHIIDVYEGECRAEYLQSQPLRRLVPLPMSPKDQISVKMTLVDGANHTIHENLYLFGDIRLAVLRLFEVSRKPVR